METFKSLMKPVLVMALSFISIFAYGQDPTDSLPGDPASIAIFAVQNMNFGAFVQGATGGTVSISAAASRSKTGDVILINQGILFNNAIFDVEAPSGTTVSILNGPDAVLIGSNGGSVTLTIGASDPVSPVLTSVTPPGRTQVRVGGTLTIGGPLASPPGIYNGTFSITIFQE